MLEATTICFIVIFDVAGTAAIAESFLQTKCNDPKVYAFQINLKPYLHYILNLNKYYDTYSKREGLN